MSKLFSIVMPTYNGAGYIKNSIEASLNQSYKNFELIIIDDGSTDRVRSICDEYAARDNRIKVITTENKGVSAARNKGIEVASGDFIVFFDDDDYPENNLLEKYIEAYNHWKNKKVSFISCGMIVQNEFNKRVSDRTILLEEGRGYIKGENYLLSRNYVATLAWLRLFNFVTNKCYDLKVIKQFGLAFDEHVSIAEDLKFNLDYLDSSEGNIGMINSPLYRYIKRKNDGLSIKYHSDDLENTKIIYRRFVDWEKKQQGVTEDNILVIKAIYIYDWTNRLTAIYNMHRGESLLSCTKRSLNKELRSHEYRSILGDIYRAKKMSSFRYACLRVGIFDLYYFFRGFYQLMKG